VTSKKVAAAATAVMALVGMPIFGGFGAGLGRTSRSGAGMAAQRVVCSLRPNGKQRLKRQINTVWVLHSPRYGAAVVTCRAL
jgi:hypothetical protein